jgi:DNA repair ATPase RecN
MMFDDIDVDQGMIVISRKIQKGRSTKNKINGESVPLKHMKQVMQRLLFLASQHQVYELLDVSNHITMFDDYLGADFKRVFDRFSDEYQRLLAIQKQYDQLMIDSDQSQQTIDELTQMVQDIDFQQFSVHEEDELLAQQSMLQALDKQRELVHAMVEYSDRILGDVSSMDDRMNEWNECSGQSVSFDVMQVMSLVEDFRQTLSSKLLDIAYLESVDIGDVNARLDIIFKSIFKYNIQSSIHIPNINRFQIRNIQ